MANNRSAIHQSDLLRNEILRLDERRRRQIARADGAFQLDLHALVSGRAPWLLDMVQGAIEHAVQRPDLALVLRRARGMGDPLEPPMEPPGTLVLEPDELPPPLPGRSAPPLEVMRFTAPPSDGNEAWGLPHLAQALQDVPARALDRTALRYPEPGEPARQLDDGTVVFDDGQRQ